jgi:DNA (cytosine-5)-methyltransferase 1
LSEKTIASFTAHSERKQSEGCGFKFEPTNGDGCAKCITSRSGNRGTDNYIEEMTDTTVCLNSKVNGKQPSVQDRIYDVKGVSTAINGINGVVIAVDTEPLLIKENTTKGFAEAYDGNCVNYAIPTSKTRRGRVGKQISNTLDANCQQGVVVKRRIRRLTPRECFRLMGVDDADIDKMQAAKISDAQQYKLAGNSIVVDVLYYIFRNLFCYEQVKQKHLSDHQLRLF